VAAKVAIVFTAGYAGPAVKLVIIAGISARRGSCSMGGDVYHQRLSQNRW
jgi:hypothetical protein